MSKDYRDTLNLPQTDLSMKAGLAKKEPELLELLGFHRSLFKNKRTE